MPGIRQRRDQAPRVRMQRIGKQHLRRRPLHNPPGIHHDDLMRDLRHHSQIMADELDGHPDPLLQLLHQVQDLRLDRHIERRRRLIRDQQCRLARQRHRDHRALAHAARQLMRIRPRPLARRRDPHRLQHRYRVRAGLVPADSLVQHLHLGNLPPHRHHRIERRHRLLEHHRHPCAPQRPPRRGRLPQHLPPLEPHRPRHCPRRRHQPHQRQRRHRLAAPALAHHPQRAPRLQPIRDPGHHLPHAPRARKPDAQPLHFQQRAHSDRHSSAPSLE